jgi:predicted nucleotidyltransferase
LEQAIVAILTNVRKERTIVRIMRTNEPKQLLDYLMPSRVRREVLCSLLLDEREWHPRELARVLGLSNSAVALELQHLRTYGMATSRRIGNQSRYSVNTECPVYPELRSLMVKTAGVADRLRAALAPLASQIEFAYIFGSFADSSQRSGSDVDVMVVGAVKLDEVLRALAPVERDLRREVNAAVYWPEDYRQQLMLGQGFIHQLHLGPKIMLAGLINEFV